MAMRLVLFGAPGSGKGTQSEFLKFHYGVPHISTGEMFREAIQNNTSLGNRTKKFINAGELVPDEVVIALVLEKLSRKECTRGFLLDGFPRTTKQAMMLNMNLEMLKSPLSAVLSFEVPYDVLIERLSGRRLCPICATVYHLNDLITSSQICKADGAALVQRKDDYEKIVRVRLLAFKKQSLPLKEFYNNKNLLLQIDGSKLIREVYREIDAKLAVV